jgi:UDPglucose 6-dehydrogenase
MAKKKNNLIIVANISIVGYGIVGQALAYGFSRPEVEGSYNISFYDKYKKSASLASVLKNGDFIFICLPTPMKSDESGIDLSIIQKTINKITRYTDNTDKIVVIKSTVIPGTTTSFEKKYPNTKFCFNPEFLTEANYLKDFLNADRTIIGASNDLVSRRVTALFKQRFPHIKVFQTDPTTAEMVKYTTNTYLATKVIFANQIFDLCDKLGIKYEEVKAMTVADSRIYNSHLDITTERGFGGKCFPKDIVALLGLGKKHFVNLDLLSTVWKINKQIRKVKDWKEIPFVVTKKSKDRDRKKPKK